MKNRLRVLLTGTPGVGKSAIARALAQKHRGIWVNELAFAKKHRIGARALDNEWEIPLETMEKKLSAWMEKQSRPVFLDGHVLCEARLALDRVVVLTCDEDALKARLVARKYSDVKVLDNLWVEKSQYCLKKARRVFGRKVKKVSASQRMHTTLFRVEKALGI